MEPAHRRELAQRLTDSAARLSRAAAAIQATAADPQRSAHLVDGGDTTPEAAATVSAFGRELVDALAAVVDLSAHDDPDREPPDLAWFEFRCANAVFGQHPDTIRRR